MVSLARSHRERAGRPNLTTVARPNVTLALDKLTLRLSAPNAALLTQIAAFWCESFFLEEVQAPPGTATIQIDFGEPGTIPPEAHRAQPIYRSPDLSVWGCANGFLLCCGASWLQLDLAHNRAWGVLALDFGRTRPQDQRDFVLLTLLMIGHRHGYYGLHANGLSDGQTGYLIVGPSGSGKSTLALRLIEQGWQHSGDDLVLLHAACAPAEGVHALALRRDFALSAKTLAYCAPHLAAGDPVRAALAPGDKTIIASSHFGVTQPSLQLRPRRLLFAILIDQVESRLEKLDQAHALVRLAHQSAGLLSDRHIAPTQMQLLAKLCQQAHPYQLWLGRDVLTNPALVAQLLQSAPYRDDT